MYWPSVCDFGPIRGCVLSTIININHLYGATYSQTVCVLKYSPRHAWFLRLLEVKVLRSEHFVYHKKNTKDPLVYGVFLKNKSVMFHSWGRRLIPESLASEVQAV